MHGILIYLVTFLLCLISCNKKNYKVYSYKNSENAKILLWKNETYSLYNFNNTMLDYDTGNYTKNKDTVFLTSINSESPEILIDKVDYNGKHLNSDFMIIYLKSNSPFEYIELVNDTILRSSKTIEIKEYYRTEKQYFIDKKEAYKTQFKLLCNYNFSDTTLNIYSDYFNFDTAYDTANIEYSYSFKFYSPIYNKKPFILKRKKFYPILHEE